jgi:hypothetical protein
MGCYDASWGEQFPKGILKKTLGTPIPVTKAEHLTILAASVTKLGEPQVLQVMSVILSTK